MAKDTEKKKKELKKKEKKEVKTEKKKKKNNSNNGGTEANEPKPTGQGSKITEPVTTANSGQRKLIKDPRFASVHSDPRFQRVPKHQSKVSIDARFNRMFTDKNYSSSSAPVDKRGKLKNQKSENPLRHYYRVEEEEARKKDDGSSSDEEDEESEENLQKLESGSSASESDVERSSSSSDTDDEDEIDLEEVEEEEEPKENILMIEQETRRLAVVNMDWSQIRAVDLYVLFSSFLPKDGHLLSVSIYPSEFGLKCLEEEAVHGPIGLFDSDKDKDSDGDEDEEIDNEKLRAYEKRRLRYYYAVVECDSTATADYLYKTCDGTEFERTSNVLDLRFIPDSMELKHPPRDVATQAPATYDGLDFHTHSLQHSKIHLTWEEDEPQRTKVLKRKFNANQLAELELTEFLASDDGESDDDDDENMDGQSAKETEKLEKYRALLEGGDGSDGDGEENGKDMEVTFNTELEDISKRILEKKDKKSETVWEAYLRKRREKKAARKNRSKNSSEDDSSDTDMETSEQPDDFFIEEPVKSKVGKSTRKEKQQQVADEDQEVTRAELELLLADEQGPEKSIKGYNLKRKKAKSKKETILSEGKIPDVDYNDPRFSALFKSPHFALDPTDPQYKRSAAYARKLVQKQHNIAGEKNTDVELMEHPKLAKLLSEDIDPKSNKPLRDKSKHELSSLVRSVKKKAQQAQMRTGDYHKKKRVELQPDIVSSKEKNRELSSLVQSVKKKAKFLHN